MRGTLMGYGGFGDNQSRRDIFALVNTGVHAVDDATLAGWIRDWWVERQGR